ncbi:MAG: CRR6 family NdhI maturation factor [Cyanobacterium sp. T60_A2020_053]|nr:CRR6 family NdhI maturation factor [Cyanobacterium sp. T60_A2020_053]
MDIIIKITQENIDQLDLSPVTSVINKLQAENGVMGAEQKIKFNIDYPRQETDPREWSEMPEIRLWFIAVDVRYGYLPLLLNWREGELARYVAMLVPHQFNRSEGIQYNSEALDIFIMTKMFFLHQWLKTQGITGNARLRALAQIFGYDLDDSFFALLQQ